MFPMTLNLSGKPFNRRDRLVFDPARRKSVRSGPEEEVRQAMIAFLTTELKVPVGLISVEKMIEGSAQPLRADIVVYDRRGNPWMIIECKAREVRINQTTFDQISRYNRYLGAAYLLVSNGCDHYCCHQDSASGSLSFVSTVPRFPVPGKECEEEG